MSLSEGETSYICIHGANISVLLASFVITWLYFWRVKWSLDSFSFKMSRIPGQIIVSDSFTVLMDDSSKENQSLREQLTPKDDHSCPCTSWSRYFTRKLHWSACRSVWFQTKAEETSAVKLPDHAEKIPLPLESIRRRPKEFKGASGGLCSLRTTHVI